tara:strand:+ start:1898 stop:2308 length:411 start_codon:yes stop_codon:yes gene_type:complete
MGDLGSCFLGIIIATLFLQSAFRGPPDSFFILLSTLIPILNDTISTILIRIKNGEHFFSTPHKQHSYQLLSMLGVKYWQVSLIYGFKLVISTSLISFLIKSGLNYYQIIFGIILLIFMDIYMITSVRRIAYNKNII